MIGQFVVRNFLYRPNCQEQNYHFAALNLKRVKERRLSTLRNWMLTLSFNILICVYLWRKAFKKLNHNLITEENSSQCLKILSQYTVKKTKVNWLKGKQAVPSTNTCMITNIPANIPAPDHLDKLLCHLQCFSQRPTAMCTVFAYKPKFEWIRILFAWLWINAPTNSYEITTLV